MEQAVNDLELQNEQEFLDNFYTEHIEDVAENTGIFVNATSFWISSNLYRHVYQNCFFDNTIIYFGTNTHAGESGVEDWESDVLSHRGYIKGYVVSYYGKGKYRRFLLCGRFHRAFFLVPKIPQVDGNCHEVDI